MQNLLLYIGPGLGFGTILMVFIVLLIIIASLGMIIWTPIKRVIYRITKTKSKQKN